MLSSNKAMKIVYGLKIFVDHTLKEVWKKNSFLIDLVGRLLELSRDARNACTTWI